MKVKRVCCRIIWQKTIDGHHLKNCRMTNQEATKGCQRIRVDSVMTGYDYVDLSGETQFPDQLISDDGKLERSYSYSHSFFFTSLLTLPPFPHFPDYYFLVHFYFNLCRLACQTCPRFIDGTKCLAIKKQHQTIDRS